MGITIDDFIAGWFGGVCGLVVGHPLDTIKVRQQTFGTSMFVATKRTFKHEGLRGFYKGLLFPLLTIGPSNAIFFGVYGNVMNLMQHTSQREHTISYSNSLAIERVFIAGSVAGFFQVLFTCPVELIKTVLQARTEGKGSWKAHYEVPYAGSFDAFKGILRDRGIKGLFRGINAMMLRDVPTSGLYTLTYEMLLYSHFSHCETPVLVKQMVAGGLAGVISWVPVLPIDVVKSRMQVEDPAVPEFRTFRSTFMTLLQTRGVKVFCRGIGPLSIGSLIKNAVVFLGYESIVSWVLVIPLDVVKSRIQADDPVKPMYRGVIDCLVKIHKTEGFRVFFRGLPAIVLRAFPANGMIFVGYEVALAAASSTIE